MQISFLVPLNFPFIYSVLANGHTENKHRGGNFMLNAGRQHRRTKSTGKVSKSSAKFYENSADELSGGGGSESGGSTGRNRFFEIYESQQRYTF